MVENKHIQIINALTLESGKGALFSAADIAHIAALLSAAEQKNKTAHAG